jgi:hypothetical protein
MHITLQYFDSCPNWRIAESRVKSIIDDNDLEVTLSYQRIETPEDAERYGFAGSPTLIIDGQDPFAPETPQVGLACRTYLTAAGTAESPTVEQLEKALGV